MSKGIRGWTAGVDEAGRGPLAGPVVAAAVILCRPLSGRSALARLNDSKKVSSRVREDLFLEIARYALVGIGVVNESEIDRINIYQATKRAMTQAVLNLPRTPDLI
ncbi:MAG: ribonuclease HII, partial [Candidatus Omnitrophica bacterium]|nr:ribonuclease HII [Candidatus Omnitrophota bacterium]